MLHLGIVWRAQIGSNQFVPRTNKKLDAIYLLYCCTFGGCHRPEKNPLAICGGKVILISMESTGFSCGKGDFFSAFRSRLKCQDLYYQIRDLHEFIEQRFSEQALGRCVFAP